MPVTITNGLDNVGAAIGRVIEPYLIDVAFSGYALFSILYEKGKIMEHDPMFDITWSVMTDKLNAGSYKGLYRFPQQEKQIFRPATVPWKQGFAEAVVSGIQALTARGIYAGFQLADALKQAARMSIMDFMGTQVFTDGFGNGGADFDGSAVAIDNGTLYPTYATIDRATVPGWNSYVDPAGGPFSFSAMTNAQLRATWGGDAPDLAITDQNTWQQAANRISTQQIFNKNNQEGNDVASLGFRVIDNLGCNLCFDQHAPAGTLTGYNTEYLRLSVMKDRVWSWTGWKDIPGSDGWTGRFLLIGNLQFLAPRSFFMMSGLT